MHLLLSLVLMQDPSASRFDVSGGATAQLQAGRAPPNPGLDPTPAVLAVVTPVARLHWAARARNQNAVLSYSPRLLYRFPNILNLNRPLLLHQIGGRYARGLTPTWSMVTGLAANIGEIDYTTAQQVFGDQQGNLPNASVVSYAAIGANIGFTGMLNPVHRLSLGVGADFRTPYGESSETDDPNSQALLPQQTSGSGTVSHGYLVRSTDTLTTTLSGQYVDFDNRGASYIVSGTYGWAHRIDSRLTSNIEAGLFLSQQTRAPEGFEQRVVGGTPVRPVFSAGLAGRLYNRTRLRITGNFGVSSSAFLDSVAGEVVPRAGASTGVTFFVPPSWTAGVQANFFTVATLEPRDFGEDANTAQQQETVISFRTPVSYQFRNNSYALEFGSIVSARGPHLRAGDFQFRQLEVWGYVAVAFEFASGRLRARSAGGGGSTVSGGAVN